MPIYMDVFPLERSILIVARGQVSVEEILDCIGKLKAPKIRGYAKIVDVTGSTSEVTLEQVDRITGLLRCQPEGPLRGPLAFVVDPARKGFADMFADATRGDRPISLFGSLHEARKWLSDNLIELPGRPAQNGQSHSRV
ncbi:hypothetical protein [Reyranella sp.]|uniref:hypothetical protein n=1 Tax=Reyranella sp. TaxID=1929291 RepID=UPI003C7AFBFB